jgi:hypothetical protein
MKKVLAIVAFWPLVNYGALLSPQLFVFTEYNKVIEV